MTHDELLDKYAELTVRSGLNVANGQQVVITAPIEALDLTVRSYNCLKREGIHTVGELISRSEQDLLDIRNFGAKSIDEVKAKLQTLGLALKDSPPGWDASASFAADDDQSFAEDESF